MAFRKLNNEIMHIRSDAANANIAAEIVLIEAALHPPVHSLIDFVNTDADKVYMKFAQVVGAAGWQQLVDYT